MITMPRSKWEWLGVGAICLVTIEWLIFLYFFLHWGGVANGRVVRGHYFLEDHHHYIEVSRGVYLFSLWHQRVLFTTWFLTAIVGSWVQWQQRKQKAEAEGGASGA